MKNDYGDPKRGLCHEYVNFLATLEKMENIHVAAFFYDEVLTQKGMKAMNEHLIAAVKETSPDICFFVLFTDEITKGTIQWITEKSGAKTFNWFTDDHWRFDLHSKFYAPLFHYIVTTDHESIEKYMHIGCENVLLSQWGFNHHNLRQQQTSYVQDVSFIGQVHSTRRQLVQKLLQKNIAVECWGQGWENGRIPADEMRMKFVQSRVNLNFASSSNAVTIKRLSKIFLHRRSDNTVRLNSPLQMGREVQTLFKYQRPQIKGRNFEIPGHGGFLLTEYVDTIDQYFIPDKEIVLFRNFDELVEKTSFYLYHEEQREMIRSAGHQRTFTDHTYEKRFQKIFSSILGSF